MRPELIDRFRQYRIKEKKYRELAKKLETKLRKLLKDGDYPDCRLIDVPGEKIDPEKAKRWAKKFLTKDEYNSLFYKQFDLNAFADLIAKKNLVKRMYKRGIITNTSRQDIRISYK